MEFYYFSNLVTTVLQPYKVAAKLLQPSYFCMGISKALFVKPLQASTVLQNVCLATACQTKQLSPQLVKGHIAISHDINV